MKKALALLLALTLVFALAACNGKTDPGAQTENSTDEASLTAPAYTWPQKNNALFGDVPAPDAQLDYNRETKDEKGSSYEFGVKKISYEKFKAYIDDLKAAGFRTYDASGLGMAAVEPTLPAALSEAVPSASWSGSRRGLYISAVYSASSLSPEYELRIFFYTYNPFEN